MKSLTRSVRGMATAMATTIAMLAVAASAGTEDGATGIGTGATPKEKYILFCAGCHGYDGEGGGGGGGTRAIAPFIDTVGLFLKDHEGRRYLVNTGGVSSAGMTDEETAIVLNYVLGTFGGRSTPRDFQPYTSEEVAGLRARTVADPASMRRQIAKRLKARGIALPDGHWD